MGIQFETSSQFLLGVTFYGGFGGGWLLAKELIKLEVSEDYKLAAFLVYGIVEGLVGSAFACSYARKAVPWQLYMRLFDIIVNCGTAATCGGMAFCSCTGIPQVAVFVLTAIYTFSLEPEIDAVIDALKSSDPTAAISKGGEHYDTLFWLDFKQVILEAIISLLAAASGKGGFILAILVAKGLIELLKYKALERWLLSGEFPDPQTHEM